MHLATYSKADAGRMLAHYERAIGERDHIDPDGRVYNLAPAGDIHKRFEELTRGLEIGAKTRPLADFVVTQPKGYEGDTESLFKAVYDSLAARVGEEHVVAAYVHLDEPGARPHMHFAFVPVVETPVMTNDKTQPLLWTKRDEKKNPAHKAGTQKRDGKGTPRYKRVPLLGEDGRPVVRRTAAASKLFSKDDLRNLHPRVEQEVCAALGVERVGLVLDEDDDARKLSSLDHGEYERVTAEIERKRTEEAEVSERLERLRQRESELGEEVAALESSAEGIAASAAALVGSRGAGEREEALRGDVERLRGALVESEGEGDRLGERVAELERELPGLRERHRELERRFAAVERRVREAIGRLREVPSTLSEWALDIARELGRRVYDPRSIEWQMRRAREAAASQPPVEWRQRRGRSR